MNIAELSKFRGGVSVDTITELTSASGVTIDGMLIKDGGTKVSNVINASGTSAIYSAGAWDFKNASGTSTLTISDAGVVTVGAAGVHTFGGATDSQTSIVIKGQSSGTAASLRFYRQATEHWGIYLDSTGPGGASGLQFYNTPSAIYTGGCSAAGAWTLGPTSGTTVVQHALYGYDSSGNKRPVTIKNRYDDESYLRIEGTTNGISIGSNAGQALLTGVSGKTASGGATVYVNSGNALGTSTSVREAKTNMQPLGSTLGWLKELKPYVYQYRKQVDGVYTDEPEEFVNTGLIYDEVKQVNPQLCFDTEDGKPSGVEYTRLITPMLKAIQEQQAMIEALTARLAALEAK